MKNLRPLAAAMLLLGSVFAAPLAHADPMKCSGEETTCRQTCAKQAKGTLSACLTVCGTRRSVCMRTGCWDNGSVRYCGLAKQ